MRHLYILIFSTILCLQPSSAQEIITYWHFNNLPSGTLIDPIQADYTILSEISYIQYPGDGDGYMDRVNEGTTLNATFEEPSGFALRVRNPSDTRQLVLYTPTNGYEQIKISYAVVRTNNGQTFNEIEYTVDGTTWLIADISYTVTTEFELILLDFSDIADADDNPDFAIRILFTENADGSSGNNRYDNIQVTGNPIPSAVSSVVISPSSAEVGIDQQIQFTAEVLPANATNKNISWTTLDESIAVVNETGLLTALQTGSTYIVVTTEDGGFTDTATVHVKQTFSVIFMVSDANGPIENAFILLASDTLITNQAGLATTSLVPGDYAFEVEYSGYIPANGIFSVQEESELIEIQLRPFPVTLAYYWHFNDLIPGNNVAFAFADFPGNNNGIIYFGGSGNGYMDDFNEGSPLNLHLSQPAGSALRVRNPSVDRALIIEMPMTMYKDPVLIYDVQRSNNGMLRHIVEYTLDGLEWTSNGLRNNIISPNTYYNTWLIDFTGIIGIENNDRFAIRMVFEGNTDQDNGNQRFDNIALFANESEVSTNNNNNINSSLSMYPNPVQNYLFIQGLHHAGISNIRIINSVGQIVKSIKLDTGDYGNVIYIGLQELQTGLYHILIDDGKTINTAKFIKE